MKQILRVHHQTLRQFESKERLCLHTASRNTPLAGWLNLVVRMVTTDLKMEHVCGKNVFAIQCIYV